MEKTNKIILGSITGIAMVIVVIIVATSMIAVDTLDKVYPEGSDEYYEQFMEDLPPKGENWDLMLREFENRYVDLDVYGEGFYKRPEFYKESWETCKERFYRNHDYRIWGVYGHGAYPGNRKVTLGNSEVGQWISFYSFYRTGWGIETWQGIKLIPEESKYFDIKIEPDEFLLTPTFPKFTYNWSRKIKYTVTVKEKPPSGVYTIRIGAGNPSSDQAFNWFWEVLRREDRTDEQDMLEKCYNQVVNDEVDISCDEWISVARRNKYVDCGQLSMGTRMTIEIVIP